MTKVTLMAGNSRSLCRAWHALQELERSRDEKCKAPGCPVKSEGARKIRSRPSSDI
ncbi:hypothetical protein SAMN05216198_1648 [Halopseudomonas litoralis]|uniref:Uncharacterized protein n=1 Tax=Halopseudomonas litoralis TaxID=797277 RepID=A0A1H1R5K7_9GAMM|nr:hypothetical protein [Halopseudomonas litoralis]SDS30229.1 hypothetical protein SAMN05216198_1648 [Halopseudomonas litoralis]